MFLFRGQFNYTTPEHTKSYTKTINYKFITIHTQSVRALTMDVKS